MNVNTPIATNGGDSRERFSEIWAIQLEKLQAKFGNRIREVLKPGQTFTDVPIIFIEPDDLLEVLEFLKTDQSFSYDFLSDLTATDETPRVPRFDVIYQFYSMMGHWRIRVKVKVKEGQSLPSITSLWPGANWAEREVYDMYGVVFSDHPDLRRILNDSRFEGHPLRKDYDLRRYQIFGDAEPVNPRLLEER